MTTQQQIKDYLTSLNEPKKKRSEIEVLHKRILRLFPKCKLWF